MVDVGGMPIQVVAVEQVFRHQSPLLPAGRIERYRPVAHGADNDVFHVKAVRPESFHRNQRDPRPARLPGKHRRSRAASQGRHLLGGELHPEAFLAEALALRGDLPVQPLRPLSSHFRQLLPLMQALYRKPGQTVKSTGVFHQESELTPSGPG